MTDWKPKPLKLWQRRIFVPGYSAFLVLLHMLGGLSTETSMVFVVALWGFGAELKVRNARRRRRRS